MRRWIGLLAVVVGVIVPGVGSAAQERAIGDTRVFARVPEPGMPEGIVVDGGLTYVGTHVSVRGNGGDGRPSKIFAYDEAGTLQDEITIEGQDLSKTHGILFMAFDASGRLYVLDRNPPRMIRIDPATGAQETYATFPDVVSCSGPRIPENQCSEALTNLAPFPDYFAFDADGNAYVTDLEQATIFLVPAGGGEAQVWFTDQRLESVFGPNGIAVDPSGTKLVFAMTGSIQPTSPAQGIIYSLPLGPQRPSAEDLETVFTYLEPAAGPDGIAFGVSGKLYVALAGSNQVSILDPDGTEAARFPSAVDNAQSPAPYDLPASVAFDGQGSLLVTNQSYFVANADNWVVLDVWVDDVELPLIRPSLP
jgi:sugar lactone lactonase YvrE